MAVEPRPMEQQPTLRAARLSAERVLLRPLASSDAAAVFPLIHEREPILKWLIWDGPVDVQELEEGYRVWNKSSPNGHSYHFAICERASERVEGSIGARFLGHPYVADLGYWLAERSWGQGLMTEAIFLVNHLCFRHLATRAMTAEVFLGNAASARVLRKNGFDCDPYVHHRQMPDGSERQANLYTLTARRFERLFGGRVPEEELVLLLDPGS